MNGNRPSGLFIAGTDTDAGKTYVTERLAEKIFSGGARVGVYKPVASGCSPGPGGRLLSRDAVRLWHAAGRPAPIERVCPLRFSASLAPPMAAQLEGKRIELKQLETGALWWKSRCDFLLVEGAGGLLSPLGDSFDNRDLILRLGLPVVLVAPNRIGVVHQVRSTIAALRMRRKLLLHGIVLTSLQSAAETDPSMTTNADLVRHWLRRDRVTTKVHDLPFESSDLDELLVGTSFG